LGAIVDALFSAMGLCIVVAGCSSGTSDRIAYQESPDERMTRIVSAGRQTCEETDQEGSPMTEPVPLLTVGDLKSELSRWSDDTPVIFLSPLKEREFRFYRYRPGDKVLVLEINEFPETLPGVLPGA
jgi:hypothetical protein